MITTTSPLVRFYCLTPCLANFTLHICFVFCGQPPPFYILTNMANLRYPAPQKNICWLLDIPIDTKRLKDQTTHLRLTKPNGLSFGQGSWWHNWWFSPSLRQLGPQEKCGIHLHLLIERSDVLARSRDDPDVFRENSRTLKPSKLHASVEPYGNSSSELSNPSILTVFGKDSPHEWSGGPYYIP